MQLHFIKLTGLGFASFALASGVFAQTYGNTTPFASQANHLPDYVLGVQVTIPNSVTLQSFGLIYGLNSPSTANAKFAIYSSNPVNQRPNNLVAETGQVTLSTAATYDNIPFTTQPTISAGTYWMMALYNTPSTPRVQVGGSGVVSYWTASYSSGFAAVAPGSSSYVGQNFNYWVNSAAPVPEPATMAVIGLGVMGLVRRRRARA
jgi:hypothetical protein